MNGKLTVSDVRAAGFCVKGLRDWFKQNEVPVDFRTFLKEGVDLSYAETFSDPLVQKAVAIAKARSKQEGA